MTQPMQLTRKMIEGIEIDIGVFKSKIEMQKAMIEAHREKAKHDRLLVKAILDGLAAQITVQDQSARLSRDRIVSYHVLGGGSQKRRRSPLCYSSIRPDANGIASSNTRSNATRRR